MVQRCFRAMSRAGALSAAPRAACSRRTATWRYKHTAYAGWCSVACPKGPVFYFVCILHRLMRRCFGNRALQLMIRIPALAYGLAMCLAKM